jgi:hypothetical protein
VDYEPEFGPAIFLPFKWCPRNLCFLLLKKTKRRGEKEAKLLSLGYFTPTIKHQVVLEVAQVVECLPSKHRNLSSTSCTAKKEKKSRETFLELK